MNDLTIIPDGHDRRRFIGGSDAAAVLGLSKFRTPYDIYLSKTSDVPEEMDPAKKKFLERRKRWEPVVVQMLKEELEAKITNINLRYADKTVPYFAAEIDAEAEEEGEIINVEIKTVSPFAYGERHGWGEAGTGDVPIDYEAQIQHGLGVTGRKKAVLVAMVGLDSMVFYPIMRDNATIAVMRTGLITFWNEHVLTRIAPAPKTLTDLVKLYRTAKEGTVTVPSVEIASKAMRLRALQAQIDALQMEGEALEFDVKRAMGEAEALEVEGKKVITWKEQNWTRLDYEALKRDRMYTKYSLTGKHRVFKTLKG